MRTNSTYEPGKGAWNTFHGSGEKANGSEVMEDIEACSVERGILLLRGRRSGRKPGKTYLQEIPIRSLGRDANRAEEPDSILGVSREIRLHIYFSARAFDLTLRRVCNLVRGGKGLGQGQTETFVALSSPIPSRVNNARPCLWRFNTPFYSSNTHTQIGNQ